jgi:hypothetical protein
MPEEDKLYYCKTLSMHGQVLPILHGIPFNPYIVLRIYHSVQDTVHYNSINNKVFLQTLLRVLNALKNMVILRFMLYFSSIYVLTLIPIPMNHDDQTVRKKCCILKLVMLRIN